MEIRTKMENFWVPLLRGLTITMVINHLQVMG